jgi:hypothetical protein
MKDLTNRFLLVVVLMLMVPIIDGTETVNALTLLTTSNGNSTTNNDTSVLNNTSQNATSPITFDSIVEDNESGSISGLPILPGKCLGSALCPD